MDIYTLHSWMNYEYDNNLFRKDIIETLFNNLINNLNIKGIKIKDESKLYTDFLLHIIKFSKTHV